MLVRLLLLALSLSFALTSGAPAQQDSGYNYDEWVEVRTRIERILNDGLASEESLISLRSSAVEWRDRFLAAENINQQRITRINRQLEALGPPPAEGESELEQVATRRTALTEQLEELRLPGVQATESYVEADGLIAEIDATVRDRQADRVLKLYPTPLNPLNWATALRELEGIISNSWLETSVKVKARFESGFDQYPQMIAYSILSAFGLWLMMRSLVWATSLRRIAQRRESKLHRVLLSPCIDVLQVVIPYLGLLLIITAVQATGLFGSLGEAVLLSMSIFGLQLIVGTWLVGRLFPAEGQGETPLRLKSNYLRGARWSSQLMVTVGALYAAVDSIASDADFSVSTAAFLICPLAFIAGLVFINLLRMLRASTSTEIDDTDASNFADNVVNILSLFGIFIVVGAIIAGVAGYLSLLEHLVFPSITTFFLLCYVALVHKFFTEVYALATSRENAREESLVPTLIGALLIALSIPLVVLIWGARTTDLTEVWSTVRNGITVGEFTISPTEVAAFILVFGIGYGLTRLVQGALRSTILPKTKLDLGARNAAVSGMGYLGITISLMVAVTMAGINLSNLAIFASALAVGVGFGLQTIVSNFVSGIILLVERPISEGDWIEVNGQMGYVRSIAVRATRIETFDRTDVIVPNSDLVSGQVTNWTRGNLIGRVIISVGVAYGSDTRRVAEILDEVANSHPMVALSPPPSVLFMRFGADALEFEIRAILRDINFMLSVKSEMNHHIVERFAAEKIEIPFAQRDLWLRNPEVLPGARAYKGSKRHFLEDDETTEATTTTNVPQAKKPPQPAEAVPPTIEDMGENNGGEIE